MKRILMSLTFLLVVLSACNNGDSASNYYLSLSGEGEHMADFFSHHVYTGVDEEEISVHSGSESGATDIAKQTTGTIGSEGEGENFTQFPEVDEIYMDISWNNNESNGDQEERIVLYSKGENGETFLNPE